MKTSKGFTIIELLVVIAIIAVLAGIVLVNVTSYINKGKDAAIKGNLAGIMTNAAVIFDATGSYATVLTDPAITSAMTAADTAWGTGGVAANRALKTGTNDQYCVCKQLKIDTTKVYCVDFSGNKTEKTALCSATCTSGAAVTDGICK